MHLSGEEKARRMNRGLEKLYKEAFAQGRPMVVADADNEPAYRWPDGRLETIKRENDKVENNGFFKGMRAMFWRSGTSSRLAGLRVCDSRRPPVLFGHGLRLFLDKSLRQFLVR